MTSSIRLFASSLVALALYSADGQGTVVIQHSGAADPTAEGFSLVSLGSHASVRPVTGSGFSAWNTTVSNVNNNITYSYLLTSQQRAETIGADWALSFTLEDLQPNTIGNDFINAGPVLIYVGSEVNGDPYIAVPGSGTNYILNGAGSGYHNYQIFYDAVTASASLWVDGTEKISDYLHNFSIPNGVNEIQWGESQAGPSSANWNLLSFEIVPEPSAVSLLFLGSGAVICLRLRRRAGKIQ